MLGSPCSVDKTRKIQHTLNDANRGGWPGAIFIARTIYRVRNLYLKWNLRLYLQGSTVF